MIPAKCFALVAAVASAFTIAPVVPAAAQIIVPFPPYRYAGADSSVRLEVTPKQAEVYVDGYYAGIVDDFDGAFQRLHAEPGQHDITLYLEGYRTVRQSVYLMPDKTFKIKLKMEPLPPGEVSEARPVPSLPQQVLPPVTSGPAGRGPRGRRGGPNAPPPGPAPNQPPAGGAPEAQSGTGTLTIQLQPADATVLLDGQPLTAPEGQGPLVLDVSAGRHVLQVRKQGYVGYLTEIDVRRGEMTTVNVNLRTQQ